MVFFTILGVITIIIPILWMRKLRSKEVQWLVQGHTVRVYKQLDLIQTSAEELGLLMTSIIILVLVLLKITYNSPQLVCVCVCIHYEK